MSLVTSLYNKVQYLASKAVSDSEADNYAKQKAEQEKHDEDIKKRKEKAEAEAAIIAAEKEKEDKKAAQLASRSKINMNELVSDTVNGIFITLYILIFISLFLYGGHLAANQAIGYKVPFRILTFIYGAICFWYVIPKALYDIYWKGETLPNYAFIPISTFVPEGNLEKILLGPFCYQDDEYTKAARITVENLYKSAHTKSQSTTT
jgi:hypothetical protein